jgi:hypothetical protein
MKTDKQSVEISGAVVWDCEINTRLPAFDLTDSRPQYGNIPLCEDKQREAPAYFRGSCVKLIFDILVRRCRLMLYITL